MTVSSIGNSNASSYPLLDPADSLTTAGASLAMLVLDTQAIERQAGHERLEAARDDYQAALAEEVSKMHEAADQVFWGAIAQGAVAIAGGAASVYGAVGQHAEISKALAAGDDGQLQLALKDDLSQVLGRALEPLAVPVGKVASGSDGEHARAAAKSASGKGEQARWAIDDAKERIEQAEQTAERATQWAANLVDKQDAALSGLITDFA
jgi:hypothetical protein